MQLSQESTVVREKWLSLPSFPTPPVLKSIAHFQCCDGYKAQLGLDLLSGGGLMREAGLTTGHSMKAAMVLLLEKQGVDY